MSTSEFVFGTCPGCGGHKDDVWHPEEDACMVCGYRESVPATETSVGRSSRPSSGLWPHLRVPLLTLGYALAMFAGMALSEATFIMPVVTASGTVVQFSAPGGAFWVATALGVVSLFVLSLAAFGGEGR